MILIAVLLAASWLPFHHHPKAKPPQQVNPFAVSDLSAAIHWQEDLPALKKDYTGIIDPSLFDAVEKDLYDLTQTDTSSPAYQKLHDRFKNDTDNFNAATEWADGHSRI
jgi:hypothetical protein